MKIKDKFAEYWMVIVAVIIILAIIYVALSYLQSIGVNFPYDLRDFYAK